MAEMMALWQQKLAIFISNFILLFLLGAEWKTSKVKLDDMNIDSFTDIYWNFRSDLPYYKALTGDCIQIYFENPYKVDSAGTY